MRVLSRPRDSFHDIFGSGASEMTNNTGRLDLVFFFRFRFGDIFVVVVPEGRPDQ